MKKTFKEQCDFCAKTPPKHLADAKVPPGMAAFLGVNAQIYEDEYKRLSDAGVEIAGFLCPAGKAYFLILNKDK